MIDDTILQIIPCCQQLYEIGTCCDDGTAYRCRVVAFGLVEDEHGNRRVVPLSVDGLGQIDSAEGHQIEEGGGAEREAANIAD